MMEELLDKNIFRDADLLKYAPDYNSQNVFLRLQHRRDMAKDTQKSRKMKTNQLKTKLQHKIYNNSYYKVNTEIAKIHSLFRNKNAENQLILKKRRKYNVSVNPDVQCSNFDFDDDETLLEKEICTFVEDSQEIPDLTVENESDFKLLPKLKYTNIADKGPHNEHNDNIELSWKSIKKKHTINKTRKFTSRNSEDDVSEMTLSTNKHEYCDDFTKDNDLQSLLIMMTISTNYSESNDHEYSNDEMYNNSEEQKLNINDNANKKSEATTLETVEGNEISNILNIKSIKIEDDHKMRILKKYAHKWQAYVKLRSRNKIHRQRQETLNRFLDKLSKAKSTGCNTAASINKAKVLARDYNSYHHRYKVQKNIIALQKAKLEQQNKMIEELKYNKIIEASRQSLDSMKEEVRKTYYDIDKHLKPKIKLITNELNIKEIEEPSLVLHCLKMPQFLQRMEARAREREEKHAIIRERRKQIEEEKVRLKQQAELEKAEMDKEEKLKRMKELKEKRKKEKIENIRKKQHAERLRALTVMADLHYEKNIMLKYGLRPFYRLIQIKRENTEKVQIHYKFQLMKNVFLNWMFYTEDMWFERNYKAEEFYRKTILRKTFYALKQNHFGFILRKQVAEDYYDLYVTQLAFRTFRGYVKIAKAEFSMKWAKAVNYHNCNLLFKTFTCWRTLPALNALKREQEARKLKWRQKVLQVVPDYKPPDE